MEQELIGQASPEQVAAWKKEHGTIHGIVVDGHICYVKKPGRKELAYSSTAMREGPFQYLEALMDSCKLGGSEIFDTNDDFYMAAMQKVEQLGEIKKAEVVKL